MKLFIGLISGTSMDGIDAVLVDLSTHTFIHGLTYPYSKEMKQLLHAFFIKKEHPISYYSQLNTLLGREFAAAALQLLKHTPYSPSEIVAIGSHGQTLVHDTNSSIPYTVQLGCGHTIAEYTRITVVADFRTRDLVIGGQGAPFAPLYHQALFKDQGYPLAIVNVGGIANLTYLETAEETRGYDLGPGNCLMDAWIAKHLQHDYDQEGAWAATGNVIKPLLESLLHDAYFLRSPPKSVGKEYFSLDWLYPFLKNDYLTQDVQATLLQLTAITIAEGVKAESKPDKLLICGGGAHNKALLAAISKLLPQISVYSTAEFNIHPDFIEALMFAWLAEKTLSFTPVNLQTITGAQSPAILGVIYPFCEREG